MSTNFVTTLKGSVVDLEDVSSITTTFAGDDGGSDGTVTFTFKGGHTLSETSRRDSVERYFPELKQWLLRERKLGYYEAGSRKIQNGYRP